VADKHGIVVAMLLTTEHMAMAAESAEPTLVAVVAAAAAVETLADLAS
jgi:hypothetical protein